MSRGCHRIILIYTQLIITELHLDRWQRLFQCIPISLRHTHMSRGGHRLMLIYTQLINTGLLLDQ